jgi:hypothetical protein
MQQNSAQQQKQWITGTYNVDKAVRDYFEQTKPDSRVHDGSFHLHEIQKQAKLSDYD